VKRHVLAMLAIAVLSIFMTGVAGAQSSSGTTTGTLVIDNTSMPNGNVGTSYTNFLTATGGIGSPFKWSIVSGKLPDGLKMASYYGMQSTVISGTPVNVQTTTFTVRVQDGKGQTATRTYTITINAPRPLVITNDSSTLHEGTVGTYYNAGLAADGGIQPYTWAITAGQLPPGLSLSNNTISGTPTTAGTYTFTARVIDKGGQQASQQFTLTIS
jgi:Putative Ig domain